MTKPDCDIVGTSDGTYALCVRPATLTAILLALAVLAGCDSSSPEPDPLHSYDGRVIRGWLLALERQD